MSGFEESSGISADRRKFLSGAAGTALAGGIGGGLIVGASPALAAPVPAFEYRPSGLLTPDGFLRADQVPGNPFVKAWPDLGPRPYIRGYGFAELPFPSEPGAFLAHAIKTMYGVFQRCLCITPQAILNFIGLGGGTSNVSMSGGVGVGVGGGQDNLIQQISNVLLHPGEHISKGVDALLGGLFIDHDGDRDTPPSFILPINLETIFEQFIRLINPLNWPQIIVNTLKNPFSIFDELMRFFFPVKQDMKFNINVTVESFPGITLINKEIIPVQSGNQPSFPPKAAPYSTPGPVELVDRDNPGKGTLVVIEQWQPTIDHRKDLPPQVLDPSKAVYPENVDQELPCSS